MFDALPDRAARYEFLRDPQGQVLQTWYDRRSQKDLVVKLNTGGGKTVVGLLICQSSLNEGEGPVLYLAPDPYLAAQAMEQAGELGIDVTDDPRSTRFTSGEVICVLSLHRFVNGKSVFGLQGDGRPVVDVGTIIIDDAHAALATVKEKFTLTLSRDVKCRCDASAVVSLLSQRQVDGFDPMSCASVVALDGTAVRSPVAGRDISARQRGDTSHVALRARWLVPSSAARVCAGVHPLVPGPGEGPRA
ncbi:DEAD/DEAH box helicase [Streptomyces halstedii]|uniref:DEAD/DEAH box helicase n=1 Tax=Streptomyces halstedii TaxID=1944 RepID=UPI003679871B